MTCTCPKYEDGVICVVRIWDLSVRGIVVGIWNLTTVSSEGQCCNIATQLQPLARLFACI